MPVFKDYINGLGSTEFVPTPETDLFSQALQAAHAEREAYNEALTRNQSGATREIEAGWENVKSSTARTAGEFLDWQGARDYAGERAAEAAGLSAGSGFVQSSEDVEGIGSGLSYATGQVLKNLAPVATLLVPGAAGAMVGRVGLGLATGTAANWAQQTGSNLDAQIEEGAEVDLLAAGATGVAQTALDVSAGIGGRVVGALGRGARTVSTEAVEQAATRGGRAWRGRPGAAVRMAGEEGLTEGAQQALEEAQRAYVSDDYDIIEGQKRITEAVIAGAVVGGPFGGIVGDHVRRAPTPPQQQQQQGPVTDETRLLPAPPAITPAPAARPEAPGTQSELFTGATPETLRPISARSVEDAIHQGSEDKLSQTLAKRVTAALQSPTSEGVQRAYTAITDIGEAATTDKSMTEERWTALQTTLERAKEVVDNYAARRDELMNPEAAILGKPTSEPTAEVELPSVAGSIGRTGTLMVQDGQVVADPDRVEARLFGEKGGAVPGVPKRKLTAALTTTMNALRYAEARGPQHLTRVINSLRTELRKGTYSGNPVMERLRAKQVAILDDFRLSVEDLRRQQTQAVESVPRPAEPAAYAPQSVPQPSPEMRTLTNVATLQLQAQQAQAQQAQAQTDAVEAAAGNIAADALDAQSRGAQVRKSLFDEILTSDAYRGKRRSAFIKALKSNEKSLGSVSISPEEDAALMRADTQPAVQMFEAPSEPARKPSRKQERAQARTEQVAPREQRYLDTMLKDFGQRMTVLSQMPDFASRYLEQAAQLMEQMNAVVNDSTRALSQRIKDMQQGMAVVARLEADARTAPGTQKSLPGIRERVQNAPTPNTPPPAQRSAQERGEPAGDAQGELFTDKGTPTEQALGQTNESITSRLNSAMKGRTRLVLEKKPHIQRLLQHLEDFKNYDKERVRDVTDLLTLPDTTGAQAKSYVDEFVNSQQAGEPKAVTKPEQPAQTVPSPTLLGRTLGPERGEAQSVREGYAPAENEVNPVDTPSPRQQSVERILGRIVGGWKGGPKFVVIDVNNPVGEYATQAARRWHARANERGVPMGDIHYSDRDGAIVRLYVYPGMTTDSLVSTVFHESLGHFGLRSAFGKELLAVIRQIYYSTPEFKQAVDNWLKINGKNYPNIMQSEFKIELAGEEVLSDMAMSGQLGKRPGMLQKLKFLVEQFARRMGWTWFYKRHGYTGKDLEDIFAKSRFATEQRASPALTREGFNAIDSIMRWERNERALRSQEPQASERTVEQTSERFFDPLVEAARNPASLDKYLTQNGAQSMLAKRALSILDGIKSGNLSMMLGNTLVKHAESLGLKDYARLNQIMQQRRQQITARERDIDQLMVDALKLDSTGRSILGKTPVANALKSYMRDATLIGKWGYQPEWHKGKVSIDPKAKAISDKFKAEHPDAWKVADRMMEFAYNDRNKYRQAVRDFISEEAAADEKAALTPAEIKAVQERRATQLKLFDDTVPQFNGPYFPLGRFGNYVAVAKSADYLAAEQAGDVKALTKLRSDPAHYAVLFRKSMGDAQQVRAELAQNPAFKGGSVYASPRTDYFEQMGESPLMQMQKLKQMIGSELETGSVNKEAAKQMESMLKDLYIRSLADNSALRYASPREGISGADENMLRAFSEKMRADANSYGFISNYHKELAVTKSLYDEINKKPSNPQYLARKEFLREILRRRAVVQATYDSPWNGVTDKLMAASSIYHLATSPRYYVMNALQPAMFTAPLIGGRYGLHNAWSEMISTYKTLWPQMTSSDFWKGSVDVTSLDLPKDEIEFLETARNNGYLDFGAQLDAGFWQGETGVSRAVQEANHMFRTASSQVEFINRTVAGLSAYRLAKDSGKSEAEATKYGMEIINATQFNYATENQPRWFNMAPRVMTQFRKYQVGQIALQASLLKNLMDTHSKSWTSAEAKEARATLAYMYGQLGLVTGAMGLPGAQAIGVLGSALFGNDDEPINGERWLRQMVGDNLGEWALKGVPSTAAGWDLSGVGLGSLLNPLPLFDYGSLDTREGVRDFAFQAGLGAFGGMLDTVARPVAAGDVAGAAEAALPSGLRNAIKGYRMATEGVTKKNGDLLLTPDEVGIVQAGLQALGFRSPDAAEKLTKHYEQKQFEDYYSDRTSQMKRAWLEAQKANDQYRLRELELEWRRMQDTKARLGLKTSPLSTLYRAASEQRRRQQEIERPPAGFQ